MEGIGEIGKGDEEYTYCDPNNIQRVGITGIEKKSHWPFFLPWNEFIWRIRKAKLET